MDLLYYPGCTLKTSAKNLEASAFAVMAKLGHRMVEMEEWNCCGVVASLTNDDLMHHIAPLRNLINVENAGHDKVITFCDMCYNTLKQTNLRVKNSEENLKTLNSFMDQESDYKKTVKVIHLLEFLKDDVGFSTIKKAVKQPLKGLKLMPYYGCTLLRPREVALDDAEEPVILSNLLKALGAEIIDNPAKNECCGSYHTIDQKEYTRKRAYHISKIAQEKGADAIVLSCPLCRYNLDVRGTEAKKTFPEYAPIPVFYYTQLMAIALGLGIETCGFEVHATDPLPLLKKKGVLK